MPDPVPSPERVATSPRLLAAALGVWAVSTFGHGLGLQLAAGLFAWSKRPGTWLSEAGGPEGMHRLELLLSFGFGLPALAGLLVLGQQVRRLRPSRGALLREVLPWLVWAIMLRLVWTRYIVFATEFTHFVQYALVACLLALACGRGRDPQRAFLIACGLGVLDEIWQHYGLHRGDHHHWMDWTDPVLDALGAAGGVLPWVTYARLRGDPLPDTFPLLKRTFLVAACALLPLLLLSPATHAALFGSYRFHPYWSEFHNDKPVHWPGPLEGVPLVLGSLLLIGLLVEPRRRGLSQGGLAVVLALATFAARPPSRLEGMPVHQQVPTATARRTAARITVDGVLEEAWGGAQELGPFVLCNSGAPARYRTTARLLWDDQRLYVAFVVEDPDVWARDAQRDDGDLPGDEVVEVFLDDGGDEVTYFELEVSPRNVVQDLFCFVPQAPVEFEPSALFYALNAWDARGLETAVRVDGSLHVSDFDDDIPASIADRDRGYVVELALPWSAIAPYPNHSVSHHPVPPRPGDRWRLGLYRIERPRPDPGSLAGDPLSPQAARALFADPARFDRLLEERKLVPDAAGLLPRRDVRLQEARSRAELQAWSPTYQASFHDSPRFGVLVFE